MHFASMLRRAFHTSDGSQLFRALQAFNSATPQPSFTCLTSLRNFSAAEDSTAPELPVSRLERSITPDVNEALERQGFAVVDGVFGGTCATQLRHEIISLYQGKRMHLNSTHLVRDGSRSLLQKRGIWEAELLEPQVQQAAPLLGQLQRDSTLRVLLSVFMPHLRLTSQAIKAQFNEGGGACFPFHFDSAEDVDSRALSAVFYLNQDWQPQHGGQLRLFPFGMAPVDIAPLHDRLVLFASKRMLHRVMPAHAQRASFTIWFSEERSASSGRPTSLIQEALQDVESQGSLSDASAKQLLSHPEVQKLASQLFHADEWAASIVDSHDDTLERMAALEQFWTDLGKLRMVLGPLEGRLTAAFPPSDTPPINLH